MKIVSSVFACLLVAGCATSAANIEASHVSPIAYQSYNCEQLMVEAKSVSERAQSAAIAQNKRMRGDNVKMAVGLIVFWPALLFIKGDGAKAAEISRLKGEMSAIEETSQRLDCGIEFQKED